MDKFSMFRNAAGGISLSRAQAALGFLVVTGILIYQAVDQTLDNTVLLAYFGFSIGQYIGAKKIAVDKDIKEQKIDAGVNP
jgi:hypothetical protein